jgi:hypothetical protein
MATYILPTNVVVMVSLPPRDQRSSVGEATGLIEAEWETDTSLKPSTSTRAIYLSIHPSIHLSVHSICIQSTWIYVCANFPSLNLSMFDGGMWTNYIYHLDFSGFHIRGNLEWHNQTLQVWENTALKPAVNSNSYSFACSGVFTCPNSSEYFSRHSW